MARGVLSLIAARLLGKADWVHERAFDRKYAIATGGYLRLEELGDAHAAELREHGHDYHGTPVSVLGRLCRLVPKSATELTFVDLGCGLGRTLFAARELGFRRIIGVEYSGELYRRLCVNVQAASELRAAGPAIECHQQDARRFDVPREDCLVYLFNPFDETVLTEVVDNLLDSLSAVPRRLFVAYYNPWHRAVLDENPRARLVADGQLRRGFGARAMYPHAIYELR